MITRLHKCGLTKYVHCARNVHAHTYQRHRHVYYSASATLASLLSTISTSYGYQQYGPSPGGCIDAATFSLFWTRVSEDTLAVNRVVFIPPCLPHSSFDKIPPGLEHLLKTYGQDRKALYKRLFGILWVSKVLSGAIAGVCCMQLCHCTCCYSAVWVREKTSV